MHPSLVVPESISLIQTLHNACPVNKV